MREGGRVFFFFPFFSPPNHGHNGPPRPGTHPLAQRQRSQQHGDMEMQN